VFVEHIALRHAAQFVRCHDVRQNLTARRVYERQLLCSIGLDSNNFAKRFHSILRKKSSKPMELPAQFQ